MTGEMEDVHDLLDVSSVGVAARVRSGHVPRTAAGVIDLSAVKRAFAGTWVDTLVDAVYAAGFADGVESVGGGE